MNSTQVYGYSNRLRWSLTHKKAKVSYTYGNDAPAGHLKTIQNFDDTGTGLQIYIKWNVSFILIADHWDFFLVGWQTSCLEMTKLYWIAVTTFFSYTINFGDKKTHRHKYLALIKYIAIDQLVLAKMSNQFELGVNISRRNCRYCPNTTLACSVHTSCMDVCYSYLTSFNFVQTLPTWWALRQNFSTKILCPISQHCRQVRF